MIVTPQETFLSLDEAAEAMRVHPETLRSLAAAGELGHKIGKEWGFLASEVAGYCRAWKDRKQKCASTSAKGRGTRISATAESGIVDLVGRARSGKPKKPAGASLSLLPSRHPT